MIEIRLIGTVQEINDTVEQLKEIYEVHHKSPRKGRKGEEYLCYINALIPKQHRKISELETENQQLRAEIEDLCLELRSLKAPPGSAILSPKQNS